MQVFISLTFSGFVSLKMRTKVKHIISRLGIAVMMFMEPFAVSGVISRIIWINLIRSLDTTLPRVDALQNNLPTSSGFNPGTMFYHQTFNRNSWRMIQPGLLYNLFGLKGPSSRLETCYVLRIILIGKWAILTFSVSFFTDSCYISKCPLPHSCSDLEIDYPGKGG